MTRRDGVVIALDTVGSPDSPARSPAAREVLSWLGSRWVAVVVVHLRAGPLRHGALKKRAQGISQRMLTLTLRALERDGLVERTVHAGCPACVTYELTPLGRSLQTLIQAVDGWADANIATIQTSRKHFDERGQAAQTPVSAGRVHRIA